MNDESKPDNPEIIDLSNEARDRLLEVIDDPDARPNDALQRAACRKCRRCRVPLEAFEMGMCFECCAELGS